jgi:hypothetical protein
VDNHSIDHCRIGCISPVGILSAELDVLVHEWIWPMNFREILGFLLIIGGVILMPFTFWLSYRWFIPALALLAIGVPLFYTARVMRKEEEFAKESSARTDPSKPDIPLVGDVRGFPGHRAFDNEPGGGADGE